MLLHFKLNDLPQQVPLLQAEAPLEVGHLQPGVPLPLEVPPVGLLQLDHQVEVVLPQEPAKKV